MNLRFHALPVDGPLAPTPQTRVVVRRRDLSGRAEHLRGPTLRLLLQGVQAVEAGGRTLRLEPGHLLITVAPMTILLRTLGSHEPQGVTLELPAAPPPAGGLPFAEAAPVLLLPLESGSAGAWLEAVGTALLPAPVPYLAASSVEDGESWFAALLSSAGERLSAIAASRLSTRVQLLQRLECARAQMLRTLDRRLTMEELARTAALSPFHFARAYRAAFGLPPLEHHRRLRLAQAQRIIAEGAPIAQAALATGFCDQPALTRTMRRLTGRSPAQARSGG